MSTRVEASRRMAAGIAVSVLVGVAAVSWMDAVLLPPYPLKSACKLLLFTGLPLLTLRGEASRFKVLFVPQGLKRGLGEALLWGAGVFSLILGAYVLLGPLFDFSRITGNLQSSMGICRENFLAVTLYICLVNSLLEEFFFRGFAFLALERYVSRRYACLFSALTFAVYHVAMMGAILPLPLAALSLVGLAAGGGIFNFFAEKQGTLYAPWFIHMGANLAINGIAMHLFGIL